MAQRLQQLPAPDRPREKLQRHGPDQLSITELLAVLLGTGGSDRSVLELAGTMIDDIDLSRLRKAGMEELKRFPGVGTAKAATIVAAFELGRRRQHNDVIDDVESARAVLEPRITGKEQEELHAAFVTTSNKVIKAERIFKGSLRSINIEIRDIVKRALVLNAAGVVIAHNHPGGDAEPTDADVDTTKGIQTQLAMFDIGLLDHLVVGQDETTSMKQEGLISEI